MKKMFALLVVLMLLVTNMTVAFADDSSDNVEVQTRIWNQSTNTLRSGTITYDVYFNIPDRYFAYEYYALGSDGQPVNTGSYSVSLMYATTITIASGTGVANGTQYKIDWIDLEPDNYLFKITNNTNSTITVYITYYSW